jgi:hypothetical protein
VTLSFEIPGSGTLRLDYLVLDVNGTLTDRGMLVEGVENRVQRLRELSPPAASAKYAAVSPASVASTIAAWRRKTRRKARLCASTAVSAPNALAAG